MIRHENVLAIQWFPYPLKTFKLHLSNKHARVSIEFMTKSIVLMIGAAILTLSSQAHADDGDQHMTTIQKFDLGDEASQSPVYILTTFDVTKARVPGSRAHAILRQMRKRVRVEFESAGLPKGVWKLAFASSCPAGENGPITLAQYKKHWTELNDIKIKSTHVSVEKSHMDMDLRPGGQNKIVLEGKSLGLFQVLPHGKVLRIDCKPQH
jgi:hypothetical protein